MASTKVWNRYNELRSAISEAIENSMYGCYEPDDVPNEISIAISPDMEKVDCLVDPSGFELLDFIREHEGWNIESATTIEDAIDRADLYFDLR